MKYVLKKYPRHLLLFFILSIILAVISVSNALILQLITDSATKANSLSYPVLVLVVVVYIGLNAIFYYFQQYNSEFLAKKSINLYRNIVFKRIANQRVSAFENADKGNYISTMTSQMDKLEQNYFTAIYWGGYLLIQFIVACAVAVFINPLMALFAILLSIPNIFLPLFFKKILEKTTINTIKATNTYVSKITDYLNGFIDWKINGNHKLIVTQEKVANNHLLDVQKDEVKASNLATVFNNMFSNILYLGTWLVGAFFILNNQLTVGTIVAFSQLVTKISFPIYSFSDMFSQFVSGKKLFTEIESEFKSNKGNNKLATINSFEQIEIEQVEVNYKGKDKPIKFVDINIIPKKKYLITGPSGSGKTTLFRLITKQILHYEGKILFNKIDLNQINDQSIFDQIAYLPQNGHVFNTTLANNLTLYKSNYTSEQLIKALEFVELNKWANSTSLNKIISSDKVSGGEAKRIELARLLLQKKSILVLDEFSSGIDKTTLKKIENKLLDLQTTILYITHVLDDNLSSRFDEVIKLK